MDFHPISEFFPLMDADSLQSLKADIEKNGQHEPIWLYESKILDGRNRYNACLELGIQPITKVYEGDSPTSFVISLNLERRHLNSEQRAGSSLMALPMLEAEAKKRQGARTDIVEKIPQSSEGRSRDKAAEMFHTNPRYVSDMKKIRDEEPEKFDQIMSGEKRLSDVKREQKKKERIATLSQINTKNAPLNSAKQYPVIYCDPPWRYEHSVSTSREIENQYPTMSLEEIRQLPVSSIAYEDSILFMWATSPKLHEAFTVLDAWGFTYRTCAVWDKQKIGMGYYFRQRHELLLVATRGNIPPPDPANRPPSVFSYPRGQHSEKPLEVYGLIESMYPELEKIELFCRAPRPGWDVWGNQSDAA